MDLEHLGELSYSFYCEMEEISNLPRRIASRRSQISMAGCALSMEHWLAVRTMLFDELYPSAIYGHRAQRNSLIRAIWHCFKADESELRKLNPSCSLEDDSQLAVMAPMDTMKTWVIQNGWKNGSDGISHMIHDTSVWFREFLPVRWQPMPRPTLGYPQQAMIALQRDSNGLLFMSVLLTLLMNKNRDYLSNLRQMAWEFDVCLPEVLSAYSDPGRWDD